MLIRNGLTFALCICFFCIKFIDSLVQGLNRVNGNEGMVTYNSQNWKTCDYCQYLGESCFIDILQQEGIWESKYKCEMPCSNYTVDHLPRNGVQDIVCCPLTRHPSISASSTIFTAVVISLYPMHVHDLPAACMLCRQRNVNGCIFILIDTECAMANMSHRRINFIYPLTFQL